MAKSRVKVTDRGVGKLLRAAKATQTAAVRVGILGSEASAGKRQREGGPSSASVALVAAAHELGLGVPLRSWLRTPVDTMRPEIEKRLAILARKVMEGALTGDTALEQLGLWIQGRLQKGIAAGLPVKPLHPINVARKGSSKPLIDTGQLRSSITYEVVRR